MKVGRSSVCLNVSIAAAEGGGVVGIVEMDDVPAIALEPLADILGEGEVGACPRS